VSHTMTVKELIEQMNAVVLENPDALTYEVQTEGCDCDGDAATAECKPKRKVLYITRRHEYDYDR